MFLFKKNNIMINKMSRYERRLNPNKYNARRTNNTSSSNKRSVSPRPGTATCKLRSKPKKMLSGFITVQEKNTNSLNNENNIYDNNKMNVSSSSISSNVMIQEVESKKIVDTEDDIIRRVMTINEELKFTIARTRNPTLKRLLGHELRLNTLELNLDCLTNLKCDQVSREQENVSEIKSIEDTVNKVNTFDETMEKMNLERNQIKSQIIEIKKSQVELQDISERNQESMTGKLMVLDEIKREIDEIKENSQKKEDDDENDARMENLNQEINSLKQENERLNQELSSIKNYVRSIVDKLRDEDVCHIDDMVY